jgi:hypothetical protein
MVGSLVLHVVSLLVSAGQVSMYPCSHMFDTLFKGHVVPEAISGGPIALVKDGDKIIIDADTCEINWLVDAEEQARRKKEWDASGKNQLREKRGILYKYARDVAVSVITYSITQRH